MNIYSRPALTLIPKRATSKQICLDFSISPTRLLSKENLYKLLSSEDGGGGDEIISLFCLSIRNND
jgi:hypothetical protein